MPLGNFTSSSRILRQVYLLRYITMSFVIVMMILAMTVLNIKLPILPLVSILFLMAVLDLFMRSIITQEKEVSDKTIFVQLLFDILFFSLILYFSGGATSPFTFLYLIPLAITAIVIPGLRAWIMTGLTIVLYSLLLRFYVPLNYQTVDHSTMNHDGFFSQHVVGMWFGFLVSAILVTWFITYLSKELKRRDLAISDARQRELRDQQMITLGTLAAGTAHELGTPLATLAIVAGDITEGYEKCRDAELFENQRVLSEQVQCCKKILSVLSDSTGEPRAESGYAMPVTEFLDLIIDQWKQQSQDIPCNVQTDISDSVANLLYDRTISQALINLLNNAGEASYSPVQVRASVKNGEMHFEILDSGSGISDEQIAMAGEVTFSNKPGGMGIGLYLAITTVRRIGGSVTFNRLNTGGTCTLVRLPLL